MSDLVRELGRDPARVVRRRIGFAALAGAGVLAFIAGRSSDVLRGDVCTGAEAELASVWTPAARASAIERIAALGAYGRALAPRLAAALDEHAARWVAGHDDACHAHVGGTQTDAMYDRRIACLARGHAALAAVAELVDRAAAETLPNVATAVSSLTDPASCSDIDALVAEVAPPPGAIAMLVARQREQLAQARVQIAAGQLTEARAVAAGSVAAARTLGYRPLLAEALLVEGHATMLQKPRDAVPVLAEASTTALASGADALAVEAWARRASAEGTDVDPRAALAGRELVEALAARVPSARFSRALLYNNIGQVELANEHRAEAQRAFERALAESQGVTGPGTVELINVRTNLALVLEDRARADRLLVEAEAELERVLGREHPFTLQAHWKRATRTMQELRPTAELLTMVCEQLEQHPSLSASTALCWTELGFLRGELGELTAAGDAIQRAIRLDADRPELPGYGALFRGDASGAERLFTAALARLPEVADEPVWTRFARAKLRLGLGRARRARGDLAGAREVLDRSVGELERTVRTYPSTTLERQLGRARIELAFALAGTGARPAEVAAVAQPAAAWLQRVGGRPEELAALEGLARVK
jgi:tetratricopeptide (TPR) repeat protein